MWSKIFPYYPIRLKTGKGLKVKIGSRRIYCDLPLILINFLDEIGYRYGRKGIIKAEFEKEKRKWLEKNKKIVYFNGKPIATFQLIESPYYDKPILQYKVNWKTFFAYLDNLANKTAQEIKKKGEKGLSILYNQIYNNYYELLSTSPIYLKDRIIPSTSENLRLLENFRRVLLLSGEKKKIEELLRKIKTAIQNLEAHYKKGNPSIIFYTSELKKNIDDALESFEIINIPSVFLYLRKVLEIFVKLFVYMDVAKNFKNHEEKILRILYFYDKLDPKKKLSHIKKFKKQFQNKDINKLLGKMAKERVPVLGVGSHTIKEFCQINKIDQPLANYWKACSYVVHIQSSFPFYSLLEIKSLRAFLEILINDLIESILQITKISKKQLLKEKEFDIKKDLLNNSTFPKKKVLEKLHRIFEKKEKSIKKRLKEISKNSELRQNNFFKPETLACIFKLLDIGYTKIKEDIFQLEDINEIVSNLHASGFKVDIQTEVNLTFEIFYLNLLPFLENIAPILRNLPENEKRGVVWYLLIIYLPKILQISL